MDVLKPLDDSSSIFMLFTKRLTSVKFNELLNKIQEFISTLQEEDLTDTSALKELTVKLDPSGSGTQSFILNYHLLPAQKPTKNNSPIQSPPQNSNNFTTSSNEPFSQPQSSSFSQPQVSPYDIPHPTKKTKLDQTIQLEQNNQPSPPQFYKKNQNYSILTRDLPQQNYPDYDDYGHRKESRKSLPPPPNQANVLPHPSYHSQNTMHNHFKHQPSKNHASPSPPINEQNQHRDYFEEACYDTPNQENAYNFETPKFQGPNTSSLATYLPKALEKQSLKGEKSLQEKVTRYNFQPSPNFPSTFGILPPCNFSLDRIRPGQVSKKLGEALGMESERVAPPYLSKLIKVGIPNYYRDEPFYGINAHVPKNYDVGSWLLSGVSAGMIEGERKEKKNNEDDKKESPKRTTDQEFLDKFLRKPQVFIQNFTHNGYCPPSMPQKTIEID